MVLLGKKKKKDCDSIKDELSGQEKNPSSSTDISTQSSSVKKKSKRNRSKSTSCEVSSESNSISTKKVNKRNKRKRRKDKSISHDQESKRIPIPKLFSADSFYHQPNSEDSSTSVYAQSSTPRFKHIHSRSRKKETRDSSASTVSGDCSDSGNSKNDSPRSPFTRKLSTILASIPNRRSPKRSRSSSAVAKSEETIAKGTVLNADDLKALAMLTEGNSQEKDTSGITEEEMKEAEDLLSTLSHPSVYSNNKQRFYFSEPEECSFSGSDSLGNRNGEYVHAAVLDAVVLLEKRRDKEKSRFMLEAKMDLFNTQFPLPEHAEDEFNLSDDCTDEQLDGGDDSSIEYSLNITNSDLLEDEEDLFYVSEPSTEFVSTIDNISIPDSSEIDILSEDIDNLCISVSKSVDEDDVLVPNVVQPQRVSILGNSDRNRSVRSMESSLDMELESLSDLSISQEYKSDIDEHESKKYITDESNNNIINPSLPCEVNVENNDTFNSTIEKTHQSLEATSVDMDAKIVRYPSISFIGDLNFQDTQPDSTDNVKPNISTEKDELSDIVLRKSVVELSKKKIRSHSERSSRKPIKFRFGIVTQDICCKCNKVVYQMEKLQGTERIWHRSCYRCVKCDRVLPALPRLEIDKQPYCRQHYSGYIR